jgi:hypothetical protein
MDSVIDKACRGSEVPLRALWCKATGGGGRLIHNPITGRSGVGSRVIEWLQ